MNILVIVLLLITDNHNFINERMESCGCRAIYSKLFPLTSIRRFVLDQIIIWIKIFLPYVVSLTGILLLCLTIGVVVTPYFETKADQTSILMQIMFGVLVLITTVSVVGIVGLFIFIIIYSVYTNDYLEWLKGQRVEIYDEECAIHVPIQYNQFNITINYILPIGSKRRYFVRLLIIGIVIAIPVTIYSMISIYLFRIVSGNPVTVWTKLSKEKTECPWFLALLFSLTGQLLILLIILGIWAMFHEPCSEAWRKHVRQTASANQKNNL